MTDVALLIAIVVLLFGPVVIAAWADHREKLHKERMAMAKKDCRYD